jgi:hypothetical protein
MQKKCDLYFSDPAKSTRLKFVELFDKSFIYEAEKIYAGYLHVNVDRIKLVSVVTDLRGNGLSCSSVPTEYRDHASISMVAAQSLASEYAKTIGTTVVLSKGSASKSPPVYWIFDLLYENSRDEKAGGVVIVDRLDGHIWSGSEYEEYWYDYNNVL